MIPRYKKVVTILSLLFIATISLGAITWIKYSYFNNASGLNDAFSPIVIEDNEASNLQNVVFTTYGTFKARDGFTNLNDQRYGAGCGVKYVKFSNGDQFLVGVFSDDKIRAMDYGGSGPDGTWVDITSDSINIGQNNLSSFVVAQDSLVIEDGVNTTRPFMWHGDVLIGACELTGPPPNATVFAYHKNTGFAAGNSAAQSTLYFTDTGNIKNWTTGLSGNINVETNDGSIIRALTPGFDALYIFKDYSIWRLTGDDKDNFQLQRMIQGIGCISPQSIKSLGNIFFFISSQGDVYLYDGAVNLTRISTKVQNTLDDSSFSRFQYTSGLIFNQDYYLSITSSGQTTNDTILMYDTFNSAWTKFNGININAMDVADDGTGKDTLVFLDYHGNAFKYPSGITDHGDAIDAYYFTKQFLFPEAGPNKDFKLLKVYAGEETVTNTLYVDVLPDFSTAGFSGSMDITSDDTYTKLLSHLNGFNTSPNVIDSSSSKHTFTAYGNASLATSVKKFGSASGSFNGATAYFSSADSADWDFGTGDFTLDAWVYPTTLANSKDYRIISAGGNQEGANNLWSFGLSINSSGVRRFNFVVNNNDGSGHLNYLSDTFSMSVDTWYHVAVARNGNTFYFFLDGVNIGTATVTANAINGGTTGLKIGARTEDVGAVTEHFAGNIDEVRLSKGITRWINNFDVATVEYSGDDDLTIARFEVNKEGNLYRVKFYGSAPWEVKGYEIFVEPSDRI